MMVDASDIPHAYLLTCTLKDKQARLHEIPVLLFAGVSREGGVMNHATDMGTRKDKSVLFGGPFL